MTEELSEKHKEELAKAGTSSEEVEEAVKELQADAAKMRKTGEKLAKKAKKKTAKKKAAKKKMTKKKTTKKKTKAEAEQDFQDSLSPGERAWKRLKDKGPKRIGDKHVRGLLKEFFIKGYEQGE